MDRSLPEQSAAKLYQEEIAVPETAIDQNGHVNNVVFVQWMQDIAVRHFRAAGCVAAMNAVEGTWVVRSHQVEYFTPVFGGERIQITTWVANFSRVRSLRRYEFKRISDGQLLVKGETDWVFVNKNSGRPRSIPDEIKAAFLPKS